MEKLKSETPLDYAVFQLSPKRSRCELFVSRDGRTEKIASGLLKPFVAHLKVAEEQVASAAQSIKLEVGRRKKTSWFTKGTIERFVRFVSTPEVLELVNMCDAEMSQLEAAQRIYSEGTGNQLSGGTGSGAATTEDATKRELLRAIEVRLAAVRQDLSAACARANAAGFNIDSVAELQLFADMFGAHRLNEACCGFISVSERGSNLISSWKVDSDDGAIRSSYGSDMSIDDDPPSPPPPVRYQRQQEFVTYQQPSSSTITFPLSRESSISQDHGNRPMHTVPLKEREEDSSTLYQTQSVLPLRRLSVQDRISMFETKQKDNSGEKPILVKPVQLRRLSSDVPALGATVVEKAVLRRWSGASDMSIDLSAECKDNENVLCTLVAAAVSKSSEKKEDAATDSCAAQEIKVGPSLSQVSDGGLNNASSNDIEACSRCIHLNSNSAFGECDGMKNQVPGSTTSSFTSGLGDREDWEDKFKSIPGGKNVDAIHYGDQTKFKSSQRSEEHTGLQKPTTGMKDEVSFSRAMPFRNKSRGSVDILGQSVDPQSEDLSVTQTHLNISRKTSRESIGGTKLHEPLTAHDKRNEGDSLSIQRDARSVGETKVNEKKESRSSEPVSSSTVSTLEDSGPQKLTSTRQRIASEDSKKLQFQINESSSTGANIKTSILGKFVAEAHESVNFLSTPPIEKTERARQPKGRNHELNDELMMKASELEKLFAQHKIRTPSDQFTPSRKGEAASSTNHMGPLAAFSPQFYDNHLANEPSRSSKFTHHNDGDTTSKEFSMLSISEGSRGKFYDIYMQKRNTKLMEEWSSNRAEKEARLKSMQDSLERSRSEMKKKLSGSSERRTLVFEAQPRSDKLRSYNSRTILKKEQLDF